MEVTLVSPSVPLVLLALISFLAGIRTSQAPTPHRRVNGILGGFVLLAVHPSPGRKMKSIEWSFHAENSETILLAEFNEGIFERLNASDRFQQRLEMHNETSLRIKALELGDSGVYEARIKTKEGTLEDRAFLVTIYEPVPVPEIRSHSLSSTVAGCNVILECLVLGREGVNISWTRGNPLRDLGDLERYQLSPDGRSLNLSLPPNPPDSNFTCTASNPADQKSSSFVLPSICQSKDTDTDLLKWMLPVCIGLIVVTAACVGTWLWKKRREKPVSRDAVPECHYAEIKRRSPPEGNEPDPSCPHEAPPVTTIYDQIRMVPAETYEQIT
ncbi:SLAM family member 8-like [Pelodiscus sinensis]|uniref:SLAM family member 8-like n=1 Tax=Pelodiscus sinensis TaxID=13735 RepID=UPI003F6B57C1